MEIATIDDPIRVNRYVDRNNRSVMGNMGRPVFFNGAGALTADSGYYISAIQADGAADVVFSAAVYTNGESYAIPGGDKTILAGSSWVLPCSSITIVSGAGVIYIEPLTRDRI